MMRIDLHYGPQPLSEPNRSGTQTSATAFGSSPTIEAGPGEDQAVLSGAHVQVAALAAQASQLPDIRAERVEALRQAVARGAYQADPSQVAGAMMADGTARSVA